MGSNGPVAPPTTGSDAGAASPLLFVISRTDPRASSLAASRASLGALRRARTRVRRSAQKVVRREPFVMPSLRVGVLEPFRRGAPPASLRSGRQREHAACQARDRKSTRLNSSHLGISYAVFCLKKK